MFQRNLLPHSVQMQVADSSILLILIFPAMQDHFSGDSSLEWPIIIRVQLSSEISQDGNTKHRTWELLVTWRPYICM
jgi:hypothetical protein